jgi:hypothetical protein
MIQRIETTAVPVQSTGAYARWDEGDVVARAKTHSEAAFEQLVDQYKRRAFRLAWKITRHHEDAEDVVQTAFAKAFQNLPHFRGDSRFYTWLVRITVFGEMVGSSIVQCSKVPAGISVACAFAAGCRHTKNSAKNISFRIGLLLVG